MSPAELRNRRARPGDQLELPFDRDVKSHRGAEAERKVSNLERLLKGEHPVDVYHGGTYPMFMTGPEIREQFQALDGDRYDGWEQSGDAYHSNRTTVQGSRVATHATHDPNTDGWRGATIPTGGRVPPHRIVRGAAGETDPELFERKYDEAFNERYVKRPSGSSYQGSGTGATHGSWQAGEREISLGDAIHSQGYDWDKPVSLASGTGRGTYSGRGGYGKYQVLGGHHRLAVMSEDFPRQFIPVRWSTDLDDAQSQPGY